MAAVSAGSGHVTRCPLDIVRGGLPHWAIFDDLLISFHDKLILLNFEVRNLNLGILGNFRNFENSGVQLPVLGWSPIIQIYQSKSDIHNQHFDQI